MANFLIQGQTTRTVLVRALVVIYILTKFGDDWLIFVDARVLTSKLWTDGWTTNDHNSSLSTPCSGELKTLWKNIELKTLWKKEKLLLNPLPDDKI